jgi:hypothetical protein
MENPSKPPATPDAPDASRDQIEALMALPVKGRPAVTIVGDDDVTGFDPPRDEPA